MAKRGRKTKLTPEIQDKVCQALKIGSYVEGAAAYAGISKDTIYEWLKKGAKQKRGQFRQFSDAVENAMGEGEFRHVNNIYEKSQQDWKCSAWMLERKFPLRWGRKASFRVEDNGGESGQNSTPNTGSAFTEESFNAILADEVERLESELPDDEKQFED